MYKLLFFMFLNVLLIYSIKIDILFKQIKN